MNKKLHIVALGATVLALAVSALPSVSRAQGDKPDAKTLVVGQSVDVATFEPQLANSRAEANLMDHLFATLVEVGPDGKISGDLAESWDVSKDGKEITFKLKSGLKCEDGEALTAEDAVYSFERAADPANKFTGNIEFVFESAGYAGVKQIDDLSFVVNLKDWSPIAVGTLAEVYIQCKDSYSKMSLEEATTKVVASGPYKLVEHKKDEYTTIAKNENWTGAPASFDTIVWRVIPEASTRVAELLAGNVDVISNVPVDQVKPVNESGNAKVAPVQGTRRMYVGFNQRTDKFNDTEGEKAIKKRDVRVALQYAVDVPTICETLLNTTCVRAASLVNDPNSNPALTPYPYDPQKAEELLDAAGYPKKADGTRFEITFQGPRGRYLNDANVVTAIGQYLSDVGIKVNLEIIDWATYRKTLPTHDAGPMFLLGSGGATWSAWYDMADISEPKGATNYTEWDGMGGKWFDLLAQSKLPENRAPEKQESIKNDMLQAMYDDSPWLWLYFQPDFYGVSNRISWEPRRDEKVHLWTATLK